MKIVCQNMLLGSKWHFYKNENKEKHTCTFWNKIILMELNGSLTNIGIVTCVKFFVQKTDYAFWLSRFKFKKKVFHLKQVLKVCFSRKIFETWGICNVALLFGELEMVSPLSRSTRPPSFSFLPPFYRNFRTKTLSVNFEKLQPPPFIKGGSELCIPLRLLAVDK